MRVLPDEITNTGKESDHQSDCADTCKNYDIDKHGASYVSLCGYGSTLSGDTDPLLTQINNRQALNREAAFS
jgi:hypothetical protein